MCLKNNSRRITYGIGCVSRMPSLSPLSSLVCYLIMLQSHRQSHFARIRLGGSPHAPWNVYMAKFDPGWEGNPVWQTGLPALAGYPTYHVNVIKLKWAIVWTGGLLHLSGLPHPPGVPHLHVNRPLVAQMWLQPIYLSIWTFLKTGDIYLSGFVKTGLRNFKCILTIWHLSGMESS